MFDPLVAVNTFKVRSMDEKCALLFVKWNLFGVTVVNSVSVCVDLFNFILNVPVNSYDNVAMFPPFYGTSIQHRDAMKSKLCYKM